MVKVLSMFVVMALSACKTEPLLTISLEEPAGETSVQRGFSGEDIKTAILMDINYKASRDNGVFRLTDEQTKQELTLKYNKILDPVWTVKNKGYFAAVEFAQYGATNRLYELVFWLSADDEDVLSVNDVSVYQHPEQDGSQWKKVARFELIHDEKLE